MAPPPANKPGSVRIRSMTAVGHGGGQSTSIHLRRHHSLGAHTSTRHQHPSTEATIGRCWYAAVKQDHRTTVRQPGHWYAAVKRDHRTAVRQPGNHLPPKTLVSPWSADHRHHRVTTGATQPRDHRSHTPPPPLRWNSRPPRSKQLPRPTPAEPWWWRPT